MRPYSDRRFEWIRDSSKYATRVMRVALIPLIFFETADTGEVSTSSLCLRW